jgi:glutamate-1-semialdehyde 2,1-aminomutase
VNSPVRAFRGVGGTPRFIVSGRGARITDADDNKLIDYVLSWGPLILGHAHPAVVSAVSEQAQRGTSFGAPTAVETELAELIVSLVPSVEMVRFVSSGTEATMSALRLARAATGRRLVLKFDGCYHGHADSFLVHAGSGVATLGLPDSPGVPAGAAGDTLTVSYNDLDQVESVFGARGDEIAAVIVEPVAGNMGLVLPRPGFLEGLREVTQKHGALLVFDEVMTGFRVSLGGAQERFGISPDLTCLGKVIGGGLPAAAYGGRADLMRMVAPEGAVYQAGTLSGNPLAMVAGFATIREIMKPGVMSGLEQHASSLALMLSDEARSAGVPLQSASAGSMWGFFFSDEVVSDYGSAKRADRDRYSRFFHGCLERGVCFAPSQFEAAFVSTAHDSATLEETRIAVRGALAA